MNPGEIRSFRVWLGFVAAAVALVLSMVVPDENKVRVEFKSVRQADGSWGAYRPIPVEDVSETHPLMILPALCLAAGWGWYFLWLYRRHEYLARRTNSTYPVQPKAAVGFHFLLGFNLYWAFRWTRPFAQLCDAVEAGLLKPASPGDPGSAASPGTFTGDLRAFSDRSSPGWVPGALLCLGLLVAAGALVPRNILLRATETIPPPRLAYLFWGLLPALGVATYLDRRFVAAFVSAVESASSKSKSTLGL